MRMIVASFEFGPLTFRNPYLPHGATKGDGTETPAVRKLRGTLFRFKRLQSVKLIFRNEPTLAWHRTLFAFPESSHQFSLSVVVFRHSTYKQRVMPFPRDDRKSEGDTGLGKDAWLN